MTTEESIKLKRLFEIYEQPLYRIAYAVLKNQHLAEDAVSDAFMKIIDKLSRLGEPNSAETKNYMIKVIRSTAITQYRKNKRYIEKNLSEEVILTEIPDRYTDVEDEAMERIPSELPDYLDENERKLLILRCVQGLSWKETAECLVVSEVTARKRFERIKKKIISRKGGKIL